MQYAASLAAVFGAQVFLLHVMEPLVFGLDIPLTYPEEPPGVMQKLVETMQQWVHRVRGLGIEAEGRFLTGAAFVEIVKVAKQYGADLIVMGTHGRTGLSHVLLGSTAERVIQRAPCPVLTVKTRGRPAVPLEKEGAGREWVPLVEVPGMGDGHEAQ